jgi:hypothetical protein
VRPRRALAHARTVAGWSDPIFQDGGSDAISGRRPLQTCRNIAFLCSGSSVIKPGQPYTAKKNDARATQRSARPPVKLLALLQPLLTEGLPRIVSSTVGIGSREPFGRGMYDRFINRTLGEDAAARLRSAVIGRINVRGCQTAAQRC